MSDVNKRPHDESLAKRYEELLEKSLDEAKQLKEKSGTSLHQIIDKSADKFAELGHITEEEALSLTEYLKRDLREAANYMVEHGKDFTDWLALDVQLIEDKLLEMMMSAADQTTVELLQLKEQSEQAGYESGDIIAPGSLICDQCGNKLELTGVQPLPACGQCGHTHFHRTR